MNRAFHAGACIAIASVLWTTRYPCTASVAELPASLEPAPGTAQCNYELLRAFSGFVDANPPLRYTLGAGTLLGAMRTEPAGLLQWEHDVDVYVPARDATELVRLLQEQCGDGATASDATVAASRWKSPFCSVLQYRGFVGAQGEPCCGFGFKLYHRASTTCELDVLVLGRSPAPYMHGETLLWPPWGVLAARPWHLLASRILYDGLYYVIPEDVSEKLLMSDPARWCGGAAGRAAGGSRGEMGAPGAGASGEWEWCGGPPLSFFQGEYFKEAELFPAKKLQFYDLQVRDATPAAPSPPRVAIPRRRPYLCPLVTDGPLAGAVATVLPRAGQHPGRPVGVAPPHLRPVLRRRRPPDGARRIRGGPARPQVRSPEAACCGANRRLR
jgi:hypothetical protein